MVVNGYLPIFLCKNIVYEDLAHFSGQFLTHHYFLTPLTIAIIAVYELVD